MKTTIFSICIALISNTIMANNAKFEQAMGKTLQKYAQCQTLNDYQALANNFDVIAKAEPTEWLPLYYQANCYIIMAFMEKAENKDAILVPANAIINKMLEMVPDESEVYVLQSMYYSAKLIVNPQERGQKYGALTNEAIQKALAFNPKNPRAKYMQFQNELGTAAFFKQDLAPIYAKAQGILDHWDDFTPESSLHPNWGKDQLEALIDNNK